MDRVVCPTQRGIDEVQFAAVAIRLRNPAEPERQHIGVLYRATKKQEVQLLHLAWHNDLQNNKPTEAYHWIVPKLPAMRLRQLAAKCREFWESFGQAVPYGFSPPNECLDYHKAKLIFTPDLIGLTCASLVLAIFELAGVPLVEYGSWPEDRPDDAVFRESMIQFARMRDDVDEFHVVRMASEQPAPRVRPSEVAGATVAYPPAANFETASKIAAEIVEKLRIEHV